VDNGRQAKRKYQNEVKKAKSAHGRTFLENVKKNDVWTAHQFTKKRLGSTVPGGHNYPSAASLNLAIMQHFFPESPNPVDMEPPSVTGALCRKTDPKIATVLKTQSRSKD